MREMVGSTVEASGRVSWVAQVARQEKVLAGKLEQPSSQTWIYGITAYPRSGEEKSPTQSMGDRS
jgi:hypothetical protein